MTRMAFAIFRYFPFGGLQGDMLRFAACAAGKGCEVVIFCDRWSGEKPASPAVKVRELPVRGWSNHARARSFEKLFLRAIAAERFDATFAFNRIGGCDYYFAADNCLAGIFREKHRQTTLKLLPRYRTFLAQEREIFDPAASTIIFTIADQQKPDYQKHYSTPDARFVPLPPGVRPECRRPEEARAAEIRRRFRREIGVPEEAVLLITVGANLKLKGADRALEALKKLPDNFVLALAGNCDPGLTAAADDPTVRERVFKLGPWQRIPELLFSADLMIHPARVDATGSVLLEALAAGLPALATDVCGFSRQLTEAGMPVITGGFTMEKLHDGIAEAMARLPELRRRALEYADSHEIFQRYEKGVSFILGRCAGTAPSAR